MALFGKKSNDANSGAAPTATPTADTGKKPGRGLSLGRKKDAAPAPAAPAPAAPGGGATPAGAEDFADFSDANLGAGPAAPAAANGTGRRGRGAATRRPAKKKLKSGTVVGLNIGNDSIKAIELRIKGDAITVTAMGMVPTPTESISNGVVMSVSTLAQAIRDLFKQAGIGSRGVISSVSGTGSLVVRVIEVPQMTDNELAENMKVDADRYIPFPPSEVVMDFRALRDLPTDPNSGNMEVLLAAAQREIIDLHINVLQAAKLTPQSIDVEPLAVARTLLQSGEVSTSGYVDYNDVSTIMNMGATSTEISVLRGDILVFTRSVPVGGNALTQHIVDNLGLPWHDAERLKRDWGDALPPHTAGPPAASGGYPPGGNYPAATAPAGEWNEFADFTATPAAAADYPADATAAGFEHDAASPGAAAPPAAAPAPAASTDPFDLDFFSQGPTSSDPSEQHGQKQDEEGGKPVPTFDFSNFDFEGESTAAAASAPPPVAATPAPAPAPEPAAEPEPAPVAQAAPAPTAPAPAEPAPAEPAPPAGSGFTFSFPEEDAGATAPKSFNFNMDDLPEPAPLASAPVSATPAASPAATEPAAPFAGFGLDDAPATTTAAGGPDTVPTTATPAMPDATMETIHAASPSAYDTGNLTPVAHTPTAPSPASTPAPADDFDIDSLFAAGPQTTAPAAGQADPSSFDTAFGASASPGMMSGIAPPAGVAPPAGGEAAPHDFGVGFEQFGAGLGANDTAMAGIQPETVHGIIRPLLDELAGETRRSLEYYASRYPDTVIRHVTLVGGGAKLKNIDAFLTQMLGIPTTIGNPLARMTVRAPKLPPEYADQNSAFFAVAVGLALRDVV